jgi:hypothetical protein
MTIAIFAATLVSGCSSFSFEPTANWWRDGGRLCAATRDPASEDWRHAAPRTCAQAEAEAQPLGK